MPRRVECNYPANGEIRKDYPAKRSRANVDKNNCAERLVFCAEFRRSRTTLVGNQLRLSAKCLFNKKSGTEEREERVRSSRAVLNKAASERWAISIS